MSENIYLIPCSLVSNVFIVMAIAVILSVFVLLLLLLIFKNLMPLSNSKK